MEREVAATLSETACHMTSVSLGMGQEENKDLGEISTFGRRKEKQRRRKRDLEELGRERNQDGAES